MLVREKTALYLDLIVLIVGRGLQVIAGFFTIKIATTILSPAQLGSLNQVTSLAVLGTAAVPVPISAYMGRGCLEWRDSGVLRDRLSSYFLLVMVVGLLLGLAAWVLQSQTFVVSGVTAAWVGGLVMLYTVGFSLHTMGSTGLNLIGNRALYVFFGNVAVWGGLFMAVGFTQTEGSPETWLLGIVCGFLLSSLGYLFLFWHGRANLGVDRSEDKGVLPFDGWTVFMFVWPQAVTFALWWVQSQSYRFILTWVADIADVGLFAAGYMICSVPMQTFETLLNEYYNPALFRSLKGQDKTGVAAAWNAYAAVYIPAVILFGAFLVGNASFLVKLLLGEQFQAVVPILLWTAVTETLRAVSSSLHQLGLAKVDMTVNILPVSVGAVTAPTMVYFLASHEPLMGTAMALFIAGLGVLALVIPISHRALPVIWPTRRIGAALLCGVPLILTGWGLTLFFAELTAPQAGLALLMSTILLLFFLYAFSREWLCKVKQLAVKTV